jgi:DNA-directed RNA polymerase subunit RPC12/RpoP
MLTCVKCATDLDAAIAEVPEDGEDHKITCPKCGNEAKIKRYAADSETARRLHAVASGDTRTVTVHGRLASGELDSEAIVLSGQPLDDEGNGE